VSKRSRIVVIVSLACLLGVGAPKKCEASTAIVASRPDEDAGDANPNVETESDEAGTTASTETAAEIDSDADITSPAGSTDEDSDEDVRATRLVEQYTLKVATPVSVVMKLLTQGDFDPGIEFRINSDLKTFRVEATSRDHKRIEDAIGEMDRVEPLPNPADAEIADLETADLETANSEADGLSGDSVAKPATRQTVELPEFVPMGDRLETEDLNLESLKAPVDRSPAKKTAYLGVVRDRRRRDATVGRVRKDQPADKAGIKRGDVIYRLDGKIVRNFRELAAGLKEFEAGDNVSIIFLRNGTANAVSVKLGSLPGSSGD